ncbi:MAG: alginate export family protein [Planctomycetota bacterium]
MSLRLRWAAVAACLTAGATLGQAAYGQADLESAFDYTQTQAPLSAKLPELGRLHEAVDQSAGDVSLTGCCEPSCEAGCDCADDVGCGDCCGIGCGGCGGKKKAGKPSPCQTSHKGLYFANDFSYLNDPCYDGCCLGDSFKQLPIGCGKVDIGGQLRLRQHSEQGMGHPGQLGFQDTDEDFLLTRLRLYTNWQVNDWARIFVEGIFADNANDADFVPRPIDENFGDFLNLFADVKVTDTTTLRVGRQELLYGAQRHISPLDWANTRRTFEGVSMLYKGDDWKVDGFYTNFVPVDPNELDEGDWDRRFYGVYATYTGAKTASYDLFYIGFDDDRPLGSALPGSRDFSVHTFGGRLFGGKGQWLWDMEGAYQTGRQSGLGLDHRAAMCTLGCGRKIDAPWSPTFWVYWDWASGDNGEGAFNRYNQLFPLAHKYLGFADFVARSNVNSPNCLLTMKPSSKWTLLCWYYYIGADLGSDIIPGVATNTVPIQNTTSDDWGHELDLIARYQIVPRSNILFGYSNVWAGDKIVDPKSDANFFYTQWELNF